MLKFAHLTDLHVSARYDEAVGYDPLATTEKALSHILAHYPEIEFLAVTGDLANWGEAAAYGRLAPLLREFPRPLHLIIGNHDNRDNFLAAFEDLHPYVRPYAQYGIDHGEYRLVFADTATVGTHGGALSADRLAWLDRELSSASRPVLLFMHHHPTPSGSPAYDAKGLTNWPEFHALLRRHAGTVRHIFHGHCHASLQGHVCGISFSGLRSMTIQAHTDLKMDRACRWYGAPHYAIAVVGPDTLVTHHVEFLHAGPMIYRDRQNFADFVRHCAERGVVVPQSLPVLEAAE